MAPPLFRVTGVDRVEWGERRGDYERPDMRIRFIDRKGRPSPGELDLGGFQIDAWTVQEGVYGGCDEVRVLDLNAGGGQLEFGRYVVQFLRAGAVVGEHAADSVTVRQAASPAVGAGHGGGMLHE